MQIKTTLILSPHTCWDGYFQSQNISVGKDMEKGEPLCTFVGNVNWYSHNGKYFEILQKIKNRTTI